MQTRFSARQRADSTLADCEDILRRCVHCGFCLPACPTYALLGDERDSPRGRIYLIKDMLEQDRPASEEEARHIDRCLSCLSCMPACPSDVKYQHLIDHARVHVEATRRRPFLERFVRTALAAVLPEPHRLRAALGLARLAAVLAPLLPAPLRSGLELARSVKPSSGAQIVPGVYPAEGRPRLRVALLPGCVQDVVAAGITASAVRVLTRHGMDVVVPDGLGCCGALEHHLGAAQRSQDRAARNTEALAKEMDSAAGLDAVVTTASGCGVMMRDYGFLLRDNAALAPAAGKLSGLVRDVTEILDEVGLRGSMAASNPPAVAYHPACALKNGMRVEEPPWRLLRAAGFDVKEIPDGHMCCGSAGTYNILQPAIARDLRERKAGHISGTGAQILATGNIGCMVQLGPALPMPVVHTVELLDWATGGPKPPGLPA